MACAACSVGRDRTSDDFARQPHQGPRKPSARSIVGRTAAIGPPHCQSMASLSRGVSTADHRCGADCGHHYRQHRVARRTHPRVVVRIPCRRTASRLRVCSNLAYERHRVRAVVLGARSWRPRRKAATPAPGPGLPLSSDVHAGFGPGLVTVLSRLSVHVIHQRDGIQSDRHNAPHDVGKALDDAPVLRLFADRRRCCIARGEHFELIRYPRYSASLALPPSRSRTKVKSVSTPGRPNIPGIVEQGEHLEGRSNGTRSL